MSPHRRQQWIYLIADLLSAECVWIAFLLFRWLVYEGKVFGIDSVLIPAFGFVTPLIIYPIGCLVVYYLSGYYLRPLHKRYGEELWTTLISALIISLTAFFAIIIDDVVPEYHRYFMSLVVLFGLQFIISYLPRLLITFLSRRHHIEEEAVIIDLPKSADDKELYRRIAEAYPSGKAIWVVPRVYDMLTGAARIGELDGKPMVPITEHKMSDSGLCIKRACDVVIAGLSLIILSPLYALIAVLIRCSSKGPVLYRQERIGLHGVPFKIFKFRTMTVDAEPDEPQLSAVDDPRVTKIGHWLRKYRLDELPQMWNVLMGDMSLVGPRPERAFFIAQIQEQAPYYCLIYKIRPGLTSWGPIRVGYTDTIAKMVERLNYDIVYMENMSIALDIKILFYTIGVLFNGKGQ